MTFVGKGRALIVVSWVATQDSAGDASSGRRWDTMRELDLRDVGDATASGWDNPWLLDHEEGKVQRRAAFFLGAGIRVD